MVLPHQNKFINTCTFNTLTLCVGLLKMYITLLHSLFFSMYTFLITPNLQKNPTYLFYDLYYLLLISKNRAI